jgi:hypothetical protein
VEPSFRCGRWDEYQTDQDCAYFKHPNGTLIYLRDIQCGFPIRTTNSTAHSYPCCSVLRCICAYRPCSMLLRPILPHSVLCRSVLCVPCRAAPFCSGSWGGICFCVVFYCALLWFSCFRCVLLILAILFLVFVVSCTTIICRNMFFYVLLCCILLRSVLFSRILRCVLLCCFCVALLSFRCPKLL